MPSKSINHFLKLDWSSLNKIDRVKKLLQNLLSQTKDFGNKDCDRGNIERFPQFLVKTF